MPEALRESIRTVDDVVAIEPGPWVVTTSVESLIRAATAIRAERRVRFDYESREGARTRRQIEPYAVMHTDGRWYLIGYCLSRKAMRTFRLDRVSGLAMGAGTFKRPADFDARRYMQTSMPFIQAQYQIDVWIELPIAEAQQVFAMWRVAIEEEDGGTRFRCSRDRLEMIAGLLLSAGRRIVVHSPDELRQTFKEMAGLAMRAATRLPD
jgi:predicted DNA-binding transcriptional regulator YafY